MASMRLLRVSLVVAIALAASGCGAAKNQATAGGASLVPASTPAYVSINTDLSSDQWKKVDSLLRKFPARSSLLSAAKAGLPPGIDYAKDLKPALGPELDIVLLDLANGGSNAVALTQPKDDAKFKALMDRANKADTSGSKAVISKIGAWTVVSDSMAKIDRFRSESAGAAKLAGDGGFKDAMAQLPGKSIVSVYARWQSLLAGAKQVLPTTIPGGTPNFSSGQQPDAVAAALSAGSDGFQFVGAFSSKKAPQASEFTSKLLANVPGDAILFASFRGGGQVDQQLQGLQSNPQYGVWLKQFEMSLGVQVAPLLALLKGEVAFYVRPQAPIPEVTLVLETTDEQSALSTVDKMVRRLTPKITSAQQGGVTVKSANFGSFTVNYATFDKKLIITSGDQAIQAFRSSGSKLPDAKAFKDARSAAGSPDKTDGFLYVNLKDGIPLIERYAGLAGSAVPGSVLQNLAPLKAIVAWSTLTGRTSAVKLFLQIQ